MMASARRPAAQPHVLAFGIVICFQCIDLLSLELRDGIYLPPFFSNGPANKRRVGPSCDGSSIKTARTKCTLLLSRASVPRC